MGWSRCYAYLACLRTRERRPWAAIDSTTSRSVAHAVHAASLVRSAERESDVTSRHRAVVSRRHEPARWWKSERRRRGRGLLIHAAVGKGGGAGTPRGKRSGWAAYAASQDLGPLLATVAATGPEWMS